MLNRLSGQDLINKNLLQSNNIEKLSIGTRNPYADIDKNLLIDEANISNEAMSLYQRDLDIKKFTTLAMSDIDDLSHNNLVAQNVFNKMDSNFENTIIEGIFNSKTFLDDLFG